MSLSFPRYVMTSPAALTPHRGMELIDHELVPLKREPKSKSSCRIGFQLSQRAFLPASDAGGLMIIPRWSPAKPRIVGQNDVAAYGILTPPRADFSYEVPGGIGTRCYRFLRLSLGSCICQCFVGLSHYARIHCR